MLENQHRIVNLSASLLTRLSVLGRFLELAEVWCSLIPLIVIMKHVLEAMVKRHETISLFDHPLFTMVSIDTPLTDALKLPADACYAYIIQGDRQVFSESGNISAVSGHTILSLCGLTLGRMLSEQPEGSIHSVIVHLNREVLNHVFEGEKPELWEELQTPVVRYVVQSAANALVKHYFDGIIQLFHNKAALTGTILKLKLKELILLLLQAGNSENIRQIIKSLFSDRQFSFGELVDAHIATSDSVKNLAVLTNCSISTFKRKFKENYGTTPAKHRQILKIEKAAERLRTSDEPISIIGYDCGFNNPEHLSRVFKEKFGLTPTEYRVSLSIK